VWLGNSPAIGLDSRIKALAAEQEPLSPRPVVEVAVGVLIDAAGAILLGQRPVGKPYAGYWEFPGGKIESGETLFTALSRELQEEIDVRIDDAKEFMVLEHDYPHAYVRLHICFVKSWQGQARGLENQALGWLNIKDIDRLDIAGFDPVLPATLPILEKLKTLEVF
jgi:8-oxo-dGTP diphosphatase